MGTSTNGVKGQKGEIGLTGDKGQTGDKGHKETLTGFKRTQGHHKETL